MKKLENKVAVITGGNSGIGLAAARAYAEQGARVVILGRNAETLDEAVASIGPAATGVQGDVTRTEDIDRLVETVRETHGRVDILFANAGLGVFMPIEAVSEAEYDRQFDINVKGAYFTVQRLLPLMSQGASIILTASAVNEKGMAAGSLYFASKAAVRSFARSLAAELGPRGIRVNALSPGVVRTDFSSKVNISKEDFDGFVANVVAQAPLGREGTADDMANAAVFLASGDSAYMTAADLVVDGGWMNV